MNRFIRRAARRFVANDRLARAALLAAGLLSASWCPAAINPADWQYGQTVRVEQSGLVKISVPLETLNALRPGLEDLRLLDADGREMPYAVERPALPAPRTMAVASVSVRIEAGSTVVQLDTGVTQSVSQVSLQSPSPEFLKAVRVEGSPDGNQWAPLAQGQPIFRQRTGAEALSIRLKPGPWARLRLTLDDRRSPAIPITGAQIIVDGGLPPPSEPFEVRLEQRVEEPGQTRLWLRLAAANATLAGLDIVTPDPLFARNVTLACQQYVDGEVRETVLVRETIARGPMETSAPRRDLTIAAGVTVPAAEAVLTVENADNPPLQVAAITARRVPLFVLFQAAGPGSHTLLSGNPHCTAPRYDIAGLHARLRDTPIEVPTKGPLTTNVAFRPSTIEALRSDGAPLDVSRWPSRKPVLISGEGLQEVELDLAVLAQTDPSLRDLRLLRDGRQIPYVLERTLSVRRFTPAIRSVNDPGRPTVSRWQIVLPHRNLPITRITFTSTVTYFTRKVRLIEERRDARGIARPFSLASATLTRAMGAQPARLALPLSARPETDSLILEVENDDNTPLPVQDFDAWYSTARLLFRAPSSGSVHLYYGNDAVEAPRYDLAVAWPQLAKARRVRADLGPEEQLKPSSREKVPGSATWIFWGVLGLVVVVLLVILARLLPKPAESDQPPKS